MTKKTYTIGGRRYLQKPLVLGQWEQILAIIKIPDGTDDLSVASIVEMIGSKMATAIAIMICEDGKELRDKDVNSLRDDIRFELDTDTSFRVVEDFFLMNSIISLFERVGGIMDAVSGQAVEIVEKRAEVGSAK